MSKIVRVEFYMEFPSDFEGNLEEVLTELLEYLEVTKSRRVVAPLDHMSKSLWSEFLSAREEGRRAAAGMGTVAPECYDEVSK